MANCDQLEHDVPALYGNCLTCHIICVRSRQYCANEQSKWPHDNAHDHTKPRRITFAGRDPATQESEYDIKENSNDQKHLFRLTERTAVAALRGTRQAVDEGQCSRCIGRAQISRRFGRDDLHPTETRGSDATQFSIL